MVGLLVVVQPDVVPDLVGKAVVAGGAAFLGHRNGPAGGEGKEPAVETYEL